MFRCSDEGEGVGSSEMKTIRTNRARKLFLETLAKSCNVAESCRRANISRSAAYAWQLDDDDFAKAWADAVDEAVDKLEQKAWDRATDDGSDRMLEILLKAHRPEKYVERFKGELTGRDGEPIRALVEISFCKTDAGDQDPAS
jgi:hypothetical protein